MTKLPFRNPYLGPDDTFLERPEKHVQFRMSPSDWNAIRCSRLDGGTFSITACILLNKFANELRRRKLIDSTNPAAFESFTNGLVMLDADEYQQLRFRADRSGLHDGPAFGTGQTADGQQPNHGADENASPEVSGNPQSAGETPTSPGGGKPDGRRTRQRKSKTGIKQETYTRDNT